jgi:hypothetical protein
MCDSQPLPDQTMEKRYRQFQQAQAMGSEDSTKESSSQS